MPLDSMLGRGVVSAWVIKKADRKEGTSKEKVLRLKEHEGQWQGEEAGLLGDSRGHKRQRPVKRAGERGASRWSPEEKRNNSVLGI